MKTYDGYDNDGKFVYFEAPNFLLFRKTAVKLIKSIPGVSIIDVKINEDIFYTLMLNNRIFEIWEPFGDNSRYHIGERAIANSNELEIIKQKFSEFRPGLFAFFLNITKSKRA